MATLSLRPAHRAVRTYYESLADFERLGVTHETAVRSAFQALLESCARKRRWTLVPERAIAPGRGERVVVDGALIDAYNLAHGWWEAKDIHDDLPTEIRRKFEAGYPRDNILFQTPRRAILWQNGRPALDSDLGDPKRLIETLEAFFSWRPQEIAEWEEAVARFKDRVPDIGRGLARLIRGERESSRGFAAAFAGFLEKCRRAINPDLSEAAVEEMLVQHLLTERIFRTVLDNPDFAHRNVIAGEIEKVIDALTSKSFSRADFLQSLDRFYRAIERTAAAISDFSQKQHFLNTVYEQFFQGFSVEVADTHGIVYTPQPIVDFMVRSVEELLRTEFGRSLSDAGVHVIDPFTGTGNFMVRVMREIRKTALAEKYASELHCNEVMLLPYYIASMNIEREFYEATGSYRPFGGLCLADTFELAEERQRPLFTEENTARVERQKAAPMFVVIGNPPYNAWQVNDNDNNRNRRYETMDARVRETYARDSQATNKNALYDPYVKAIRWASDRIGEEGVVAFVTNNGFLEGLAFDGMRKRLAEDFHAIYALDLGGNARKGLKVSDANVFGIRVGVSVSFFVKKKRKPSEKGRIFYHRADDLWTKKQKFDFLNGRRHSNVAWRPITPDARRAWLTEGLRPEFAAFTPMGTKEAKAAKGEAAEAIFKTYSRGVTTSRDAWARNFDRNALAGNMRRMIAFYNEQAGQWERREDRDSNVDDFVSSDDRKISWSRDLKADLKRGAVAEYAESKLRNSLYRPFTKSNLYFDRVMNEEVYGFPSIFPTPETEMENQAICLTGAGSEKPFMVLMSNQLADLHVVGPGCGSQCFPFYTYAEDGTRRRENVTDWALARFRARYGDDAITKRDVFHYVYGLLHHPAWRERYRANLRRDLPRLPFAPDFRAFAGAGARLAEIHAGYEDAAEHPLRFDEKPGARLDWRVKRMRLSKDRTSIRYNDFLTLGEIPPEAHRYRLGNRSALEWVIDQCRVKTDRRSGIVNDPNREDDPKHIVRLVGKVIAVSLETVKIVEALPDPEGARPGRGDAPRVVSG